MKKVGKTTRSFRYNLNQIPYEYTAEVVNRFKRFCLIERVPEELWRWREMLGWMKHKLESRLPVEMSITSDIQMTPPL